MRMKLSLLSWERGLKYKRLRKLERNCVAPLVGAWIEIAGEASAPHQVSSLLSWERGLKSIPLILIFTPP